MCVTFIFLAEWSKIQIMKGLFQKNAIHPTLTKNDKNSLVDENKQDIIIPISNELSYFDRRLENSHCIYDHQEYNWNSVVVRRYYRNSEVPSQNESCKYEVHNNKGMLLYNVSETTEFFVKTTGCFFEPHCMELKVTCGSGNDELMKLVAEYDRTGFCNKITAHQYKRSVGAVIKKCSIIPNSFHYSIIDSHRNEIINIKSKNCLRTNLLCQKECQDFCIFLGKGKISCGEIKREDGQLSLTLTNDVDSVSKFLLIAAIVLIDLQANSRGKALFQCDLTSCLLQFIASIFCYIMVLILIFVFIFFVVR